MLALWEPGVDGRVRISGVHDPEGLLELHVGDLGNVRQFPPAALSEAANGLAGEVCLVLEVAGSEGQLGLLALLGQIDTTSRRETYHHWAQMLAAALDAEKLQHAVETSEERYAAAARAANDGLWEHSYATGESYLSERGPRPAGRPERRAGRPHRDPPGDPPGGRGQAQPDPARRQDQADTPIEMEYRVVGRSGAARWLLTRALGVATTTAWCGAS